jgi:copper transport protein
MRVVAALTVAFVLGAIAPAAASAHASVVGGVPEPGGIARQAPRALVVRFSENVDPRLAVVHVLDAHGRRVDRRTVSGSGSALSVPLAALPGGGYLVAYRVVSDDGHTISGGYGFAVGRDAAPPVVGSVASPGGRLGPAQSAARTLRDGGIAVTIGALAFLLVVWPPALRDSLGADGSWRAAEAAFARAHRRLVAGAALLGALGAAAGIVLAGASARGTSAGEGLDPSVVGAVLETSFGHGSAVALAVLLAVAGIAWRPAAPQTAELGATGLALPRRALSTEHGLAILVMGWLALSPAIAGHAASRPHWWLLVPASAAHVLAAGAWIGGVATIAVAVAAAARPLARDDRTLLVLHVLRRFSPLALGAVAIVAASGLAQAADEVGSPAALLDTGFGRAVVIKAGLLLVIVGVAAAHRERHLPSLASHAQAGTPDTPTLTAVKRTVGLEAAGLVAVLIVTGVLASSRPPAGEEAGPATIRLVFPQATAAGELTPARAGANTLRLVLARRGRAFSDLERIDVTATPPHGGRPVRVSAPARRDGSYPIPLGLAERGAWRIAVALYVDRFNVFTRETRVRIR